jgi:hypothetical protein
MSKLKEFQLTSFEQKNIVTNKELVNVDVIEINDITSSSNN